MARIRLLVSTAGHLADGVPAPAVGVPVEVDDAVAATWLDAELAELVPDEVDVDQVHADAQTYLDAVLARHASEVAALEHRIAELTTQLAAKPEPTKAPAKKAKPAAKPTEPAAKPTEPAETSTLAPSTAEAEVSAEPSA